MIARLASAPPNAIDPVSPMMTSAGNALYQRKPIAAPAGGVPRMGRAGRGRGGGGGSADARTYETTLSAVNVKMGGSGGAAGGPSMPAARFVPFAAPAIIGRAPV